MSAERTAEEWGRVAVSLPGWRWMPGMRDGFDAARVLPWVDDDETAYQRTKGPGWGEGVTIAPDREAWPDPDDLATAGCLLALLGDSVDSVIMCRIDWADADHVKGHWYVKIGTDQRKGHRYCLDQSFHAASLGRACIAAAEALGRWPGGEQ